MSCQRRRCLWTIVYYLPFVAVCAIIFLLSSMSHPPIPRFMMFSFGDKILHAIAFMGVGMAAAFGSTLRRRELNFHSYLEAWALALIYALFDEIHQSFTPHRIPSSADWVADAFGAALGILAFFALASYFKRCFNRT